MEEGEHQAPELYTICQVTGIHVEFTPFLDPVFHHIPH